eukprot:m.110149 g.110149  ORF g.110149 m.110149 type:complete len:703 (+) comp12875_c0_seq1:212-2320(+)
MSEPAVRTIAGSDDVATVARFSRGVLRTDLDSDPEDPLHSPTGVCCTADGTVFIAESGCHRIRRVDPATGLVTTHAGTGSKGSRDGHRTTATFNSPVDLAVDSKGNLYVADCGNHVIRRIDAVSGEVTRYCGEGTAGHRDGTAGIGRFDSPQGVAVDSFDNVIVADTGNHRVRLVDRATLRVSTLAGDGSAGFACGPATAASFHDPVKVAVDSADNVLVVDQINHRVQLIDRVLREVSTLAGCGIHGMVDGPGSIARFNYPQGISIDADDNVVVSDTRNHAIRLINAVTHQVITLAGAADPCFADGPTAAARFHHPAGAAIDREGRVLVADEGNHKVRQIEGVWSIAPGAPLVRGVGPLDRQLSVRTRALEAARVKHGKIEAEHAAVSARLVDAAQQRDTEAAAVARLTAQVAGFRDRVANGGLEGLTDAETYEVLRILGVSTLRPAALAAHGITSTLLPDLTEPQMRMFLRIETLGDRRRLRLALKGLANGQGFPPDRAARPGALGWSVDQVGEWLQRGGHRHLVAPFAREDLDGICLLSLELTDLTPDLGVLTVGQSSALRKDIAKLKKETFATQVDGAARGAAMDRRAVLRIVLDEDPSLRANIASAMARKTPAPVQCLCPILGVLMEDPVVAMDGETYERRAIEAWFRRSDLSPTANVAIQSRVVPNQVMLKTLSDLKSGVVQTKTSRGCVTGRAAWI